MSSSTTELLTGEANRRASKIHDAIRSVRKLLQLGDNSEALAQMKQFAQNVGASQPESCVNSSDHDDDAHLVVAWKFLFGVCYGLNDEHNAAIRIAQELVDAFPLYAEGHYLQGMSLAAQKDTVAAKGSFERGRAIDEARRGSEKSKKTFQEAVGGLKWFQHERYRRVVQRHAERVRAVIPIECPTCAFTTLWPTPCWLCPRCFTRNPDKEHHVYLWEQDARRLCFLCTKDIGPGARHHCRSCGHLVCNNCSKHSALVSVLGFDREPVRICDGCYDIANTAGSPQGTADVSDPLHTGALPLADVHDSVNAYTKRVSTYSVCSALTDDDEA